MGTAVTYAANQYTVPAYQDTGYAQGTGNLSSYLIALATGSLTISGGTLALTADANFGGSFGLVSIYYKSRTANPATAGVLRLANTDLIEWRDNANGNNLIVAMNATQTGGGTFTIPDVGVGTSASFVMTASAQTVGGQKTFTSRAVFTGSSVDIGTAGTAGVLDVYPSGATSGTMRFQCVTNGTGFGLIVTNAAHNTTTRTYTIPDAGANASFVMTQGSQTVVGSTSLSAFSGTMNGNIAAGSNKITGLANGTASGDAVNFGQFPGLKGTCLQIVETTTSTAVSGSSGTYATTNLSVSFTPKSTTSNVVILITHPLRIDTTNKTDSNSVGIRVKRDASVLRTWGQAVALQHNPAIATTDFTQFVCSFLYFDTPGTVSAVTYSTEYALTAGTGTARVDSSATNQSVMILAEFQF